MAKISDYNNIEISYDGSNIRFLENKNHLKRKLLLEIVPKRITMADLYEYVKSELRC